VGYSARLCKSKFSNNIYIIAHVCSVGADQEDSDKVFRFDSLTMYGTEAMSTKDIFEYFIDYAPSSIEWLSDNSCKFFSLRSLSS